METAVFDQRWLTIGLTAVSLLTSLAFLARNTGLTKRPTTKAPVAQSSQFIERRGKGSLRVNINTAAIEELETLPGIGPARAKLMVANRPYQSIDDLAKLQGIGTKLTNDLRPFVKMEGKTESLPLR